MIIILKQFKYLFLLVFLYACTEKRVNYKEIHEKANNFKRNYIYLLKIVSYLDTTYVAKHRLDEHNSIKFFNGKTNNVIANVIYDSLLTNPFSQFKIAEIDFNKDTKTANYTNIVFFDSDQPSLLYHYYRETNYRILNNEKSFENRYVYLENLNANCELEYTKN